MHSFRSGSLLCPGVFTVKTRWLGVLPTGSTWGNCKHQGAAPNASCRCCCSVAQSCPTHCNPMDCSTPGFPVLQSKLSFIELMIPSNHLILCRPLLLLPSIFASIRVFSNEPVLCIRWPKYWHFSISPSNEYSGLISFRMDWLDLLAVQGTLKSLFQHHSSLTLFPILEPHFLYLLVKN